MLLKRKIGSKKVMILVYMTIYMRMLTALGIKNFCRLPMKVFINLSEVNIFTKNYFFVKIYNLKKAKLIKNKIPSTMIFAAIMDIPKFSIALICVIADITPIT